jgi:ferredoxin
MHISEFLCNPTVCNYECQDACFGIHGDGSPLGFRKESLVPIIDEATCTKCLACIRACPLNAISLEGIDEDVQEPAPPPLEPIETSEHPYQISDSHSRMPEADTIFTRLQSYIPITRKMERYIILLCGLFGILLGLIALLLG